MSDFVSEIRLRLTEMRDEQYRAFNSSLIPNIPAERFIGVRTPELRALAKALSRDARVEEFLSDLPHRYFEENNLHAFIIAAYAPFPKALAEVERFLPYVDNWATCDQLSPREFMKRPPELMSAVQRWLASDSTYTLRFAINTLMRCYLDAGFEPCQLELVASVSSDEYYVNMMRAWYFATALAKQREATLPYFAQRRLDRPTHLKAIQKCVESRRISDADKAYLKTLR